MRISTKLTLLRAAAATAVVCAAAVVLLPATAMAAPATASSTVRVHSAPSLSSPVIGTVRAGETVDVGGCRNSWCYLTDEDGFVSASYLRRGGAAIGPNFNLSFNFPQGSFTIGNGGVSIGIGQPPRPPGGNGPHRDEACFYSGQNYTGDRFCLEEGERVSSLRNGWNNRISSIRNRDGLRVQVCTEPGYSHCRTYSTSAAFLGSFNNAISSIRVR